MEQYAKVGIFSALVLVLLFLALPGLCGNLDDPAAPTSGTSAMYTIDNVYHRLNDGTSATKRSGAFTEPSAGPGSTGHTFTELYDLASQRSRPQKTGQTVCYDGSGSVIVCSGTGQDGELQRGVTRPSPRFTDNSNGTVTDNLTGLIWLKNANCANGVRAWSTALADVVQLNTSGTMNSNNCSDTSKGGTHQTDWRLPNREELASLVDDAFDHPTLSNAQGNAKWTDGDAFSSVQSSAPWPAYWASTTVANDTSKAWTVFFNVGSVYNGEAKTQTYYVWPVRGGQ